MRDFLIREARLDDAENLARAYEVAWNAGMTGIAGTSLGEVVPFADQVAAFEQGVTADVPGTRIWVAEIGEQILGLAVCRVEGRAGELRHLYVIPDAWGTGVAGALHETAIRSMRELGADEAFLWVVDRNGRARRFYEREGWTPGGETKDTGLGVEEVRYRLILGP